MTSAFHGPLHDNRLKTDNCPKHFFNPANTDVVIGAKLTCTVCGGKLHLIDINQYIRGYEAAGNNGNDILPGWRD